MTLDEMLYSIVPGETARLAKAAAAFAHASVSLRAVEDRPDRAWHDPETNTVFARPGSTWAGAVKLAGVEPEFGDGPLPPDFGDRPWVPVKMAEGPLRPVFDALQMTPNSFNQYFGGPTPLASTLAGGLLGAGLGYGTGWLGEKILGKDVLEPGRLRRLGAILGGGVGALPGAYLGSVGMRLNAEDGKSPAKAWIEPNALFGKASSREMLEDLDEILEDTEPGLRKSADFAGADYADIIPVDAFNRTVWQDPNTPVGIRAATTGLIESASQSRGGINLISPMDIGRVAIGMGAGMVSGMTVGRVLGALAGLTPGAQNTLKQTGMWSGALLNVIPRAFGF